MLIKPNWGNFRAKFDGQEERAFERLCLLLFYKEHNLPTGTLRYANHPGIEAEPVTVGAEVIGCQARFIGTGHVRKAKFVRAIDVAKAKHPTLTKLFFYINVDIGRGKTPEVKDPRYKTEIEEHGKAQGVAIVWKTACFFETPFVCETNANIARHFFTPDDRVVAPSDWPSQVSANPVSNVPKRRATDFLRLKIGYSTLATLLFRSQLERAFRTAYPGVDLDWCPTPFDEQLERLASGELDLLVRWSNTVPRDKFNIETLASMPMVAMMPAEDPRASRRRLSIRDFSGVPLALPHQAQHYRLYCDLDAHFHAAGARMNVVNQSLSAAELLDRVRTDGLCTFLPNYATQMLSMKNVVSKQLLLPDFPDMSLVAVALKRRNDRLSAFMQAVRSASFAALPGQIG